MLQIRKVAVIGAGTMGGGIASETFWQPMTDTIAWARQQRCPVVCFCLATHVSDFSDQPLEANLKHPWRTTGHQLFDNLLREDHRAKQPR